MFESEFLDNQTYIHNIRFLRLPTAANEIICLYCYNDTYLWYWTRMLISSPIKVVYPISSAPEDLDKGMIQIQLLVTLSSVQEK